MKAITVHSSLRLNSLLLNDHSIQRMIAQAHTGISGPNGTRKAGPSVDTFRARSLRTPRQHMKYRISVPALALVDSCWNVPDKDSAAQITPYTAIAAAGVP